MPATEQVITALTRFTAEFKPPVDWLEIGKTYPDRTDKESLETYPVCSTNKESGQIYPIRTDKESVESYPVARANWAPAINLTCGYRFHSQV